MPILGTQGFPNVVIDAGCSGSNSHARVTGSNANATLLLSGSANGRIHASIFNHTVASLHLGFGFQPSLTLFDVKLPSGSYFEVQRPIWRGEVWGIWDANGGVAMVHDVSGSVDPTR